MEQVRQALNLDASNFYLYGQSWGGLLAMEYALKYQQHLKGLIISNMMSSIPAYNAYAKNVLMPTMDPTALAEITALDDAGDYGNPRYMALLMEHHYIHHILRMPADQWPDPILRAFKHLNHDVYVLMQGPSELGARGRLERWDRSEDLHQIEVPTLVIGAQHDSMGPRAHENGWLVRSSAVVICTARTEATSLNTTTNSDTFGDSLTSLRMSMGADSLSPERRPRP